MENAVYTAIHSVRYFSNVLMLDSYTTVRYMMIILFKLSSYYYNVNYCHDI